MLETDVIKKGGNYNMDPMKVLDLLDLTKEELSNLKDPEKPHGKLVEYRFDHYHDVFVFEDGYTEKFYIGE